MGLMTREEAIKILKPMLDSFVDYANITMKVEDDNIVDALEMAIEALEQPERIRCKDCKYRGERGLCDSWDYYISNGNFYCGCAERRTDE